VAPTVVGSRGRSWGAAALGVAIVVLSLVAVYVAWPSQGVHDTPAAHRAVPASRVAGQAASPVVPRVMGEASEATVGKGRLRSSGAASGVREAKLVMAPSGYASAEAVRVRALSRVKRAMWDAERAFVAERTDDGIAAAKRGVEEAQRLIQAGAGSPQARAARYCLFRQLQLLGRTEEAEREFEAYIGEEALAEGDEAACEMLLREALRERDAKSYVLAFSRLQSVLSFQPDDLVAARVHEQMGHVHSWQRQRELAEASFRRAIALGAPPERARVCYRYLVNVALGSGDHEQALRDAKALVALPGPDLEKANDEAMLGMVLEQTEGLPSALRHYEEVLAKYPARHCSAAKWRRDSLLAEIEQAVLEPLPRTTVKAR